MGETKGEGKDGDMRSIASEPEVLDEEERKGDANEADGDGHVRLGQSDLIDNDLVGRAISYCFSHNFLDIFESYIEKNAHIFDEAVDDEEHRLEYTESFNDYLKLYEDTMDTWVEEQGVSLEDFHNALKSTEEYGTPEEKHFLSLLLASAEYDCYYNVMVREARKQRSRIESKQ